MKKILLLSFLTINLSFIYAQTMTFAGGASEPGFTFNGWSSGGGAIWLANLAAPATVSKSAGTWNFISFTVGPFLGANNMQVTSNLGHSYNYSTASAGTHTLNWSGITTVTFTRTSGSGASADHDNFVYTVNVSCNNPTVPTVTYTPSTLCNGDNATLNISGTLNDATQWSIYTGSCGGSLVGTTPGSTYVVTPGSPNTTYFVRGEDGAGCVDESTGSCGQVNVTVNNTATNTINANVCYNSSYTYADLTVTNNIIANESHVSTLVGAAANGCDSILTENLIVLSELTGSVTSTICNEESMVINGTTYNATNPTGTEVFTNIGPNMCDSTVTINLNVLPAKTGSVTSTICNEESMVINGTTYNATNPTGTEVFTNIGPNMCDSTVTINLNVLPVKTGSVTNTICNEESMVINGTTYNATNPTGTEVFTNIGPNMCDSTVTINLNVLPVKTGSVTNTICNEESMVINGTTYNATNPTGTEVFTNIGPNMCDSTVTINLNVLPAKTGSVTSTICNEESMVINGTTYNATNSTGTEVFTNIGANMCDSTVTINLNVLPAKTGSVTSTICNEESMVINGTTYNATNPTGTEVFTGVGSNMCDSTVTINLNVLPALTGSVTNTICNEESMVINGTTYNATNPTGTEVFTGVGSNMCDSTVTINLNILPAKTGTLTQTICFGDSIVVNGTVYNSSVSGATEVFTNIGSNMCDSTVTIDLTVNPAIDITVTNSSPTLMANQSSATYRWLDCDNGNAVIPLETSQTFSASTNGNYAVEITVGSCIDTSVCESVMGVGIAEITNKVVSIYPNPTSGMVIVNLRMNSDLVSYSVITTEGRVVTEGRTFQNVIKFDLSNESKGIYFLRLNGASSNDVYKILKQ